MWHETPYFFQLTLIFIVGLCLGSFLNVCLYRLPRHISLITPRSQCTDCGHPIAWYFNVPLLSFFLLKGRCHYCQSYIPWRYPLVELLTALLWVFVYDLSLKTVSPFWFFFFFSLFLFALIVATFIDLEFFLITDVVSLGGIPVGVLAAAVIPSLMGKTSMWGAATASFFSSVGAGLLLWLIAFFGKIILKKETMGMGDIKLMAMIGAFLGIEKACLALFFGSVVGSLIGVLLILKGNAQWKSKIPFGPYLAIGALLALFFGDPFLMWYFKIV
jgi:leader peptidase (prepilin peptidase)/N-methyltransferase